ncbi:PQQ-dependent sugar dehydrogenase [Streptomyces sp. 4N509B]|uniref:PQQ-dependent sugar dehydrogenase n=1 Tax=Streptomyces sp. 4N509B TaxID=3457413 RepID=UPI003FCFB390
MLRRSTRTRRRWAGPILLAASLSLVIPLAATATASPDTTPSTTTTARTETTTETRADTAQTASVPLAEVRAGATQVAFGLRRPIALAAPDDGSDRLFVAEKRGTVRVYHPDTGLAADFLLDIREHVDETGNERGLLGIALPPDFNDSQELYLAFTAKPEGAVSLARYSLADASLEVLITQEHAEYNNHNGGQIAFGPDGYLYWSIGDGGGSGDPFDTGQRLDTLLGKILRVDVSAACGELPYCIPEDNPFVGVEGAREEIWVYGVRNAWRFSIDQEDGSLWVGDVGQGLWEEVDHLKRGQQAGVNLGWSCYEGDALFDEAQCSNDVEYTEPVFTYSHYEGNCSVTGGLVYRGQQYADLVGGTYLVTDYCTTRVWALREDGQGGYLEAEIGSLPTQITAFGTTADGEIYVVNDLPGGLHRMTFERVEPTCAVERTVEAWGTGMSVDLTVTNTGDTAVEGWNVKFPLPLGQTIIGDWETDLTQAGDIVTASNSNYNSVIPPGGSVTLGYLVSHDGEPTVPQRISLNGQTCAVS